jgi:hypothetical protein
MKTRLVAFSAERIPFAANFATADYRFCFSFAKMRASSTGDPCFDLLIFGEGHRESGWAAPGNH